MIRSGLYDPSGIVYMAHSTVRFKLYGIMLHVGDHKMTGGQIRAARALLRWTAEKLAEESGIGLATIKRAEASDQSVKMTGANTKAVRTALERGGIEFIEPNGGGPGVRLRDRVPAASDDEPAQAN